MASQFYKDPKAVPEVAPVDILAQYKGSLATHPQGRLLLAHMAELGCFLNSTSKCKSAIKVFNEMLELEPKDVEVNKQPFSI